MQGDQMQTPLGTSPTRPSVVLFVRCSPSQRSPAVLCGSLKKQQCFVVFWIVVQNLVVLTAFQQIFSGRNGNIFICTLSFSPCSEDVWRAKTRKAQVWRAKNAINTRSSVKRQRSPLYSCYADLHSFKNLVTCTAGPQIHYTIIGFHQVSFNK